MYSKFSPSLLIVFQGPGERGPVCPSIPIYRARAADDSGSPKGITIDQKAQSPKPKKARMRAASSTSPPNSGIRSLPVAICDRSHFNNFPVARQSPINGRDAVHGRQNPPKLAQLLLNRGANESRPLSVHDLPAICPLIPSPRQSLAAHPQVALGYLEFQNRNMACSSVVNSVFKASWIPSFRHELWIVVSPTRVLPVASSSVATAPFFLLYLIR